MTSTTTPAESVFLQAMALGIDPSWRRRSESERSADVAAFLDSERRSADDGVRSVLYTSVGLEAGVDIVLWRWSQTVDALERAAARSLRTGLGTWVATRDVLLGRTAASQYVAKPTEQESGLLIGERSRYLIVYPFTKSTDWYLLSREARQGVMNEHMRVGRDFPMVRQALAYSFGVDDQDFLVAYETDDLPAFGELVRQLRATDSRRSTVRDTPILLAIHRTGDELHELLGTRPASAGSEG